MELIVETAAADDPESADLVGRFLAIAFQVHDVLATYRRLLARGVSFVQAPEQQSWGGTLAFFRDPDANILTLVS